MKTFLEVGQLNKSQETSMTSVISVLKMVQNFYLGT